VHGANRLASNSLLEGLVFARRIAADITAGLPDHGEPADPGDLKSGGAVATAGRLPLQRAMSRGAGVLRSAESLKEAAVAVAAAEPAPAGTAAWEAANLFTVAGALVAAAAKREETRGCHWREDFPETGDAWLGHLLVSLGGKVDWESA
jgi:L-aspartate oxidase